MFAFATLLFICYTVYQLVALALARSKTKPVGPNQQVQNVLLKDLGYRQYINAKKG